MALGDNARDFFEVFTLDPDTGRLFWRSPPPNRAHLLGREAGFMNKGKGKNKPYWHIRAFSRTFKRSRVVFMMTQGRWPVPMADHRDGDSLNDRPDNLRECTPTQNAQNTKLRPKRSGLPLGVTRSQGRYRATIVINGKREVIGCFGEVEAARSAYSARRMEAFGEFA